MIIGWSSGLVATYGACMQSPETQSSECPGGGTLLVLAQKYASLFSPATGDSSVSNNRERREAEQLAAGWSKDEAAANVPLG
jgi:hypothetical protein